MNLVGLMVVLASALPADAAVTEAELLLRPLKAGSDIGHDWWIDSAAQEGESDIVFQFSRKGEDARLGLWLVARDSQTPAMRRTRRYAISPVFYSVPYELSAEEAEIFGQLVSLIEKNEEQGPRLLPKTRPEILSAGGEEDRPTPAVRWGIRIGLSIVGGILLLLSLRRALKPSGRAVAYLWGGAVFGAIAAAAVVSRFWGMGRLGWESLGWDEARIGLTAMTILREKSWILNYGAAGETTMSGYVAALFLAMIGNKVLALKVAGAVVGVLGVFFVFVAGRRLGGMFVGAAAAAGMAVSGLGLAFPSVLTEYTLASMLCALCLWVMAVTGEKRHPYVGLWLGICLGLAISAKATAILFAAGLIAGLFAENLLLRRGRLWSRATWVLAGALAGLAPVWLYALNDGDRYWEAIRSLAQRDPFEPGGPGEMGFFSIVWTWMGMPLVAAGAGLMGCLVTRWGKAPVAPLFGSIAAVLVGLAFLPRRQEFFRLMVLAPSTWIAAALILGHERFKSWRWGSLAVTLGIMAILAFGLERNFLSGRPTWAWRMFEPGITKAVAEKLESISPRQTVYAPLSMTYFHYFLWAPRDLPPPDDCDRVDWIARQGTCVQYLGVGPDLWYRKAWGVGDQGFEDRMVSLIKGRFDLGRTRYWFFRTRPAEVGEISPERIYRALRRALDEMRVEYSESVFRTPVREYRLVTPEETR